METIKDKNILVVGATGGIGAEATRLLVQSGGNVFITGRNSERLTELQQELGISKDRAFSLDVTKDEQVAEVANKLASAVGALDILIIASGIGIVKPLEQLSEQDFRQTLDVNLVGPFLLLKHLLPPMKEKKQGLVINIPGVLGKVPMAGASAYAAAKYGLNGMLKSVREELRRTDIRITNLYLGGVDTPFWDEDIEIRFQRSKFIAVREAARAVWFLCQQPSSGVVSEMVIQPFNHQAI